jgi:uncharacterized protein YuzE
MQIQFDRDVNAMYIEITSGEVGETIEVTNTIYVDVNHEGRPLGVEFLDADEFLPFLRQELGDAEVPSDVREAFSVHASL